MHFVIPTEIFTDFWGGGGIPVRPPIVCIPALVASSLCLDSTGDLFWILNAVESSVALSNYYIILTSFK